MKIFDTFDEFWREYFRTPGAHGFDTWTIARFTHTDDATYARQKAEGQDKLGFQPTMITLADPLRLRKEEVVIKNLSDAANASLREQCQHRFIEQLPARFGLFNPDARQADAIYKTWEQFAAEWLEREGRSLLQYNLPVLFDHVSDIEYWGWQQKGFDPCGTQRLVMTIFQYRTGRFAEIFISNTDDNDMARIKLLIQSKLAVQMQELL
jgi:hypothetical protein